jgi:hypothetical protein
MRREQQREGDKKGRETYTDTYTRTPPTQAGRKPIGIQSATPTPPGREGQRAQPGGKGIYRKTYTYRNM